MPGPAARIVEIPGPEGDRVVARPLPAAEVVARAAGENMGMCGGGGAEERRRTRKNRKGPVIKLNL